MDTPVTAQRELVVPCGISTIRDLLDLLKLINILRFLLLVLNDVLALLYLLLGRLRRKSCLSPLLAPLSSRGAVLIVDALHLELDPPQFDNVILLELVVVFLVLGHVRVGLS